MVCSPLGGQAAIFGNDGPAIRQQFHLSLAGIDHWLNGKAHTGLQQDAVSREHHGAKPGVLREIFRPIPCPQYSRTMEVVVGLHMLLDGMSDVAEMNTRLNLLNA